MRMKKRASHLIGGISGSFLGGRSRAAHADQQFVRLGPQLPARGMRRRIGNVEYDPGAFGKARQGIDEALSQGAADGVSHGRVADFFPEDETEAGAFLIHVEVSDRERGASQRPPALKDLFIHIRLVEPASIEGELYRG